MSKILSVFRKDKKVKEIELNRTFDIQNVQSFGFGLPPNLSTPIAVDPLQALFAVGTLKGTIILFNLYGLFHQVLEVSDQPISLVSFCSNLGLLVAVDQKNIIYVYSIPELKMKQVLLNLKNDCLHISNALEQDQNFAYLGNAAGEVLIYDLENKAIVNYTVPYLGRGHPQEVVCIQRHPYESDKLLIGYESAVLVWSISKEKAVQEIILKHEWGQLQATKWSPDQTGNICVATNVGVLAIYKTKSKDPIWIGSFLTQPRDRDKPTLMRQKSSGQLDKLESYKRVEEEILSKSVKYTKIEMNWLGLSDQTLVIHTVPNGSIEQESKTGQSLEITIYYGKNFEFKLENTEEFTHIRDQRRSYTIAATLSLRLKYSKDGAYGLDSRVREYLESKYVRELTQVPLLLKFTESGSTSFYNLNELISIPDRFKMVLSPFQLKSENKFYNSIHSLSGEKLTQENQFYLEQMFKHHASKEAQKCLKIDTLLNEFLDQIELSKQSKRRSKSTSVNDNVHSSVTTTELMLHFLKKIELNLKKPQYLGLLLIGDRLSKIQLFAVWLTSVAKIFCTKEGGRIEDAEKRGMMETIDQEVKIKEEDQPTPRDGMDSLPTLDWALVGKYKVTSMLMSLKCKTIVVIKSSLKQQLLEIYHLEISTSSVKFVKIKEEQMISMIEAAEIIEVDHSFFLVTGHQNGSVQIHVLHGDFKTIKVLGLSGSQDAPRVSCFSPRKLQDYDVKQMQPQGKPYLFVGFDNGLGMAYNARKWTVSAVYKTPLLVRKQEKGISETQVLKLTYIGQTQFSQTGEGFVYSVYKKQRVYQNQSSSDLNGLKTSAFSFTRG